jgi:hypothetical protein
MIKILLAFIFLPNILLAQTESSSDETTWERTVSLYKAAKLDSIKTIISFEKNKFQMRDSDELFYIYTDTLKNSFGGIEIGKLIIDYKEEFNYIKIGEWKSYYTNGKIFSIGNYGIGAYHICSGAAPRVHGYSFKKGFWNYWHENGTEMAKGNFILKKKEINESIGTQIKIEPFIGKNWKFYDLNGIEVNENVKDITEIIKTH